MTFHRKKLTLIILTFYDVKECISLYETLMQAPLPPEYDILIVDNDCQDKERLRSAIPESKILTNPRNLGYAGGNNEGVKHAINAGSEYFMILNPDIEISMEVITSLIAHLDTYPDIAFIGPRIGFRDKRDTIYSDGGFVEPKRGYRITHKNFLKKTTDHPGQLGSVDYVNGSAFMGRSSAVVQFGIMKDEFFIYFEETEWCLRARKHGWKVMIDSSISAYHLSSEKGKLYHFLMARNKIWLARFQQKYILRTSAFSLLRLLRLILNPKKSKVLKWVTIQGVARGIFESPKSGKPNI